MEGFQLAIRIAEYVAAIGAGIAAINQWVIKPLRNLYEKQMTQFNQVVKDSVEEDKRLHREIEKLDRALEIAQADIADVLGDRLVEAHSKYMAMGWCPPEAKEHFVELHRRYVERAHNHVPAKYEDDLLALPDYPA